MADRAPPCRLSDKPCKSAAFRGRSLFTGPIGAGVCRLVRRSRPPKLLDGAYVACDRRSSWLPLVCREQAWRLLPFDAGKRREGEFGQAVEQRETWSRDHTPEVSRGPHGRNRLGRTFRLPWLPADLADQGVSRAPRTWTSQNFPLTPGSPSARNQSEHESAWCGPWPHLRLAQKGSRGGSSHPGRTANSRLRR